MFFFLYIPRTSRGWMRLGQIVSAAAVVGFVAGLIYGQGSAGSGFVAALVAVWLAAMFGSRWVRDSETEWRQQEWNSSVRNAVEDFVADFEERHGRKPTQDELGDAYDAIIEAAKSKTLPA